MIALGIIVALYLLGAAQMYDLVEEAEAQAEQEGAYIPWHVKAGYILGWPVVSFINLALSVFGDKDGEDE